MARNGLQDIANKLLSIVDCQEEKTKSFLTANSNQEDYAKYDGTSTCIFWRDLLLGSRSYSDYWSGCHILATLRDDREASVAYGAQKGCIILPGPELRERPK